MRFINRLFGKRAVADKIGTTRADKLGTTRGSRPRGNTNRTVRATSPGKEFAQVKYFILSNAHEKPKRDMYNKLFVKKPILIDESKLAENINKLNKTEISELITLTKKTIANHTFSVKRINEILDEKNDPIFGNKDNSAYISYYNILEKHSKLAKVLELLKQRKTPTPIPSRSNAVLV